MAPVVPGHVNDVHDAVIAQDPLILSDCRIGDGRRALPFGRPLVVGDALLGSVGLRVGRLLGLVELPLQFSDVAVATAV